MPLQHEMVVHVETEDARVEDDRKSEDDPELFPLRPPETREMVGEKQKKHHGERRADVVEQEHEHRFESSGLPVVWPGELEERGGVEQERPGEDPCQEQRGKGLPRHQEKVDGDDKGEQKGGQPYDGEGIEIQPSRQEHDRRLLQWKTIGA